MSGNAKLLVPINVPWHQLRINKNVLKEERPPLSKKAESELRKEAQALWDNEYEAYEKLRSKSGKKEDFLWLKQLINKGTFVDKLSANTKLVQESPVFNYDCIESMVHMVNGKAKRGCIAAMEMLKELFLAEILLSDSKLKSFSDLIPYLEKKNEYRRKQQLILCIFEDKVSKLYRLFVEAIERVSHDSIDASKDKAVNTMFELLTENSEQEHFLLEKLVNKLGDPTAKRAAHVAHLLVKLVNEKHPAMKEIVIGEVERLLYRPNITQKAQYYALCFLNEILFDDNDQKVADKLIKLYFDFFKSGIKTGEVNSKMMNALLIGVNRTFPYSKLSPESFESHMNTFFKIIHYVNFNVAIQVLNLMFNVMDSGKSGYLSDRFYAVLYRSLLDCQLESCSKKAVFLNLVYRAMKKDPVVKRVKAFIKRLLQVAIHSPALVAAGIFMLISQIINSRPGINMKTTQAFACESDDDGDDDEEKYEDVKDESNEFSDNECESRKEEDLESQPSWIHSRNVRKERVCEVYSHQQRNPLYANAENELLWEVNELRKHSHPSVALFANNTMNNNAIEYDGDPFSDFTIKNFLDRFAFRNPKKISEEKSAALRQGCKFRRTSEQPTKPIDWANFAKIPEDRISAEEKFIHKYLSNRKVNKDEDNDSVTSEEFERLLGRYEPGFEKDFVSDLNSGKGAKRKRDRSEMEDISDDEMSEDEEYNAAFEDLDDELEDVFDAEDTNVAVKYKKRGHDKELSSLFASADEFAEILQKNSGSEVESDSGSESEEKRKISKRKAPKIKRTRKRRK